VLGAPFLPDRPAQFARRMQDVIARIGSDAVRFPRFGVLASRDDGMRGA